MSDDKPCGKYTPPIYDEHYAAVKNEATSECPSGVGCSIALPVITLELVKIFEDTELIEYDSTCGSDTGFTWTQTAVDFACLLKASCKQ